MLDNTRSAIAGLSLVLKFGLDTIYCFGDIVIFIFCCFGLKMPIHAHFCGVFRGTFSQTWPPIVLTPNRTIFGETRRLSHKAWKLVQRFDLGVESREKGQKDRTVKKGSHCARLKPEFTWRVTSPTSSGIQSFKMKFSAITILQESNFPFSY